MAPEGIEVPRGKMGLEPEEKVLALPPVSRHGSEPQGQAKSGIGLNQVGSRRLIQVCAGNHVADLQRTRETIDAQY